MFRSILASLCLSAAGFLPPLHGLETFRPEPLENWLETDYRIPYNFWQLNNYWDDCHLGGLQIP